MTTVYLYTLASVILVSAVSLVGIFALTFRKQLLEKMVLVLVSLAAGALLGDAFIHLIPEAFAEGDPTTQALYVIAGILLFFILEKYLHWHHYHGKDCEEVHRLGEPCPEKIHPTGYMILASDGLHNFIDGIIIGASYLVSVEVGIATTIAVVLHEIPQEIGDFGVLIHSGFTKARALFMNFLSALLAVLGALFILVIGTSTEGLVLIMIPLAAGGFIYVATADIIPELHKTTSPKHSGFQMIALLVGIAAMFLLTFAESGHENENHLEDSEKAIAYEVGSDDFEYLNSRPHTQQPFG